MHTTVLWLYIFCLHLKPFMFFKNKGHNLRAHRLSHNVSVISIKISSTDWRPPSIIVTVYPYLSVLYGAVIALCCFQKIPRIIADLGMASHIVAVVNPGRSGLRECTLVCTDQKFHSKYTLSPPPPIFVSNMIHFRPLKNLNGTSIHSVHVVAFGIVLPISEI
jgi:hypothetical protein